MRFVPAGPSNDAGATVTSGHATSPPPRLRAWAAALLLLCLATLWLQFRHIDATLPYPRHVDEAFVSGPAHRTVTTGNLHPYTFNYPSVPKYLTALGMAVGFIRSAGKLEISEVRQIGNVGYPYYETRRPMSTARRLFALLSVITLAMTGIGAWLAFRKPALLLLAPLVLLVSPLYFFHSWTYLNVDLAGTCFVMLALTTTLYATRQPSIYRAAVLPGVFVGLAIGSKYTLALVVAPVLLAIALYVPQGLRVRAMLAALAATVLSFLVADPYSLLDIPGFLNGVAWEAFHYASGHRGFTEEPGLRQFLYYMRHFASEFGPAGLALAVLGVVAHARADWRRAAVLALLPVGLLWLLVSQRVHFPRNVLSIHPILAMFAAYGLLTVHDWVLTFGEKRAPRMQKRAVRAGTAVVLLLLIPVWHIAGHFRVVPDSRNVATAWIQERIPAGWTIVVPKQLGLDRRPLEAAGRRVVEVDLQSGRDDAAVNTMMAEVPAPAVLLVPRWGADDRFPNGEQATTLNDIGRRWRVMRQFGSTDVLVNYSYSTPWGDPAFAVAVLK